MALADGLSLLFRIKADADQARREISSLSTTVSKELRQIEASSKTATTGLGSLGSGISSIISPANLLAGAGVAAGLAIFSLGKQALDAADELFDLSQKTNFAVETLSALKNAGATSGASIGTISTALGIFDKNIAKAAAGNKTLEATFARLKISTDDNEQALRDAFRALFEMSNGAEQTAAAMELFGRSGASVLGIIKETNGDLDAAIARYREMNSLVGEDAARAASELSDSMTQLGQSLQGVATELLTSLAPALKSIIGLLALISKGASAAAAGLAPLAGGGQGLGGIVEALERERNKGKARPATAGTFGLPFLQQGVELEQQAIRDRQVDLQAGGARLVRPGGGRGGGGGGVSDAARDAATELSAAIRMFREVERENQQAMREALREFKANQKEIERAAVDHLKALAEIGEIHSRARIAQLRDDAEQGKITYLEAETAITKIVADGFTKRAIELQKSIEAETKGTADYQRLTDEYGRLQALAAEFKEDAERRKREALQKTIELEDISTSKERMRARGAGESQSVEGPSGEEIFIQTEKVVDYSKKKPDFSAWKEAVADVKGMTVDSFKAMGQAMGSAIEAWVLYGAEGGQSIKKVMAQVLAALSAEAAVKAIFQLAEGFAKLAGFMPGPAALHFKSAALYGAVAIGAGVAGRALAGNSFSQGSGAGAGASASGQSNTQQSKPTPIDVNRRGGEFRVVVDIRPTDAFVVRSFTEDWRKNGDTRLTVNTDGNKATV